MNARKILYRYLLVSVIIIFGFIKLTYEICPGIEKIQILKKCVLGIDECYSLDFSYNTSCTDDPVNNWPNYLRCVSGGNRVSSIISNDVNNLPRGDISLYFEIVNLINQSQFEKLLLHMNEFDPAVQLWIIMHLFEEGEDNCGFQVLEELLSEEFECSNIKKKTIYEYAITAYSSIGFHDKVIELYRELIRLYPGNPVYYYEIGIKYLYEMEEFQAAEYYLLKSIQLEENDDWVILYGIALGAAYQTDHDEYRSKIQQYNDNYQNRIWSIYMGEYIGDFSKEERVNYLVNLLEPWIDQDLSYDKRILYSFACREFPSIGEIEVAKRACLNLTIVDPLNSDAWGIFGNVYLSYILDLNEAQSHYQKALSINPDNCDWRTNLAITFERLGKYDKAIIEYNNLLATDCSTSKLRNSLGKLYLELGMLCNAKEQFLLILNSDDESQISEAQKYLEIVSETICK